MRLFHGTAASEQDRKDRYRHQKVLCPRSPQQFRPETEIRDAQSGKRAGFDDRYGMQKRRHRRRRNTGFGQPRTKRTHRRLHAESAEADRIDQRQQIHLIPDLRRIEHTTRRKIGRRSVNQNIDHADKGKRRPAEGIIQIRPACKHRFSCKGMQNKRQRDHGKHLIEKIHRNDIFCHRNTERNAIRYRIEHKKYLFPFLMLHIFKRIQRRKRPQKCQYRSKHAPRTV